MVSTGRGMLLGSIFLEIIYNLPAHHPTGTDIIVFDSFGEDIRYVVFHLPVSPSLLRHILINKYIESPSSSFASDRKKLVHFIQ